ncbi:MAG TPA: hypothetical protein VG937_40275, partial [Polyangiaceae bacterium]|nr:hypothetical protein [Polyangiaceae bacterium]
MQLGNFGNMLGMATGFTLVMLLLSVVVTVLTQGVQAVLKLRERATYAVLVRFLESKGKNAADSRSEAGKALDMRRARRVAGKGRGGRAWVDRVLSLAIGPAKRVVHEEELAALGFSDLEKRRFAASVTDCFTSWTRWITLCCSLATAFMLQVSTSQLLSDLSTDAELRRKAFEIAATVERDEAHAAVTFASFSEINAKALDTLASENTALAPELEQVSGRATDLSDAEAELKAILAPDENRNRILERYRALMNEELDARTKRSRTAIEAAETNLASLNIGFWSRGWSFYSGPEGWDWTHLAGVLLTALLISLGAPFWYEFLRNTNALRDSLYAKPARGGSPDAVRG